MPEILNEQWAIELNQALPRMNKEVIDATIQRRLWLSMAQARGNVKTGVDGSFASKTPIDYKAVPVATFSESSKPNYAPRDYIRWTENGWKGFMATDAMAYAEYLKIGKSKEAVLNRYNRIIPKLYRGLMDFLGLQIYANSNASGHEDDFDGLETACGAGTCTAADLIAAPSGTYQGLSTTVAQSGTWSSDLTTPPNASLATDWPDGSGSPDYPYRSPKLVNYSSNNWGTGLTTWEANCQRAIRRSATWLKSTAGGDGNGRSLLGMFSSELLDGFKNSLTASKMTLSPHKEAEDLGFSDVLNFEGVAAQSEYGCPAGTGYIQDMDDVILEFLTSEMIEQHGPWQESDLVYKWCALTLGNMKADPRRLVKLYHYA